VGVSKTIGAPVAIVFDALVDEPSRLAWLPDAPLRLRTATPHRHARFDWTDGSMRVVVYLAAKGEARTTVTVQHERIPDAETLEALRARWRASLTRLERTLGSAASAGHDRGRLDSGRRMC
jgi:hypothetical protein